MRKSNLMGGLHYSTETGRIWPDGRGPIGECVGKAESKAVAHL